jgi:hypothetical protein
VTVACAASDAMAGVTGPVLAADLAWQKVMVLKPAKKEL